MNPTFGHGHQVVEEASSLVGGQHRVGWFRAASLGCGPKAVEVRGDLAGQRPRDQVRQCPTMDAGRQRGDQNVYGRASWLRPNSAHAGRRG